MSIYVYDCCYNISDAYVNKVRGLYLIQVFFYVWLGIGGFVLLYFLKFNQNHLYAIIAELVIIYLYNAFKNKHIIYSGTIMASLLGYILLRYLMIYYFTQSGKYLPLHIIPYVMMAFDAQFRESKRN